MSDWNETSERIGVRIPNLIYTGRSWQTPNLVLCAERWLTSLIRKCLLWLLFFLLYQYYNIIVSIIFPIIFDYIRGSHPNHVYRSWQTPILVLCAERWLTSLKCPSWSSGFFKLPPTMSYVYTMSYVHDVRCRTCNIRHCVVHRTCDVVRAIYRI